MMEAGANYDLMVIGGGINGVGIARDAAGRGLSVILVEKDDLASATSSSSSKLIHGGLRYLEQREFRLVAEALAEREILLKTASHLVTPLQFVMPHVSTLRPRWLIRAGLFLYDHLGIWATAAESGRSPLPRSRSINLRQPPFLSALKPEFTKGFLYWDCRVDDSRLVIANAIGAAEAGAEILTRTECTAGKRIPAGWEITMQPRTGHPIVVTTRGIVNATGPWVKQTLDACLHQPSRANLRLINGSHIVVPCLYPGNHALILQNDDRRVIFTIPYQDGYTLIGTTDVAINGAPDAPRVTAGEIDYLCRAVNRYLQRSITPSDVIWSYAGIRPLYDDGSPDPSQITRDYTLRLDTDAGKSPVLSVYGGKITTYRKLAERALEKLAPWYPGMKPPWTKDAPLPGTDITSLQSENCLARTQVLPDTIANTLRRRHGTRTEHVLSGIRTAADLGEYFGANLYAREIDYLIANEWALSGEDILYRRTKSALHMSVKQQDAVIDYVARRVQSRS